MNNQYFTPLASNGSILYPLMNHFSKCFYTILLQRLNHKNHVQKTTSLHEQLQEHLLKNLSCKQDKLQFVISPHEQLPIRKVYSIDLPPRHCNQYVATLPKQSNKIQVHQSENQNFNSAFQKVTSCPKIRICSDPRFCSKASYFIGRFCCQN